MIERLVASYLPSFLSNHQRRKRRREGVGVQQGRRTLLPRLLALGLGKIEVIILFGGRDASNCVSLCFWPGAQPCKGTWNLYARISASAHRISCCTSWSSSVDRANCKACFASSPPIRPSAHAACPRISGS